MDKGLMMSLTCRDSGSTASSVQVTSRVRLELIRRLRARRGNQGVTLVEILIVLAIVGLIAGGIAVYAIPKFQQAQKETTKQSAMALYGVTENWRTGPGHASDCPTPQLLKDQHEINATSKITDAWETPFKIVCDDDSVTVVSFGPDRKEGTADDIRIPEPANKNSQ